MRKIIFFNILVILNLIFFDFILYADSEKKGRPETRKKHNIILIDVDSLRPDHLSCYGYKRATSPGIDELASRGILFRQAISQSNFTLPSIASLFTSKYVSAHGVNLDDKKLNQMELTLAEILKIYGYSTAAYVGTPHLNKIYGFDQGFDLYHDEFQDNPEGSFKVIMPLAIEWIENHKWTNFFLFLHSYDVHTSYHCHPDFDNIYDPGYKGIVDMLYLHYAFLQKVKKGEVFLDENKTQKITLTQKDIDHIIAHYDGGITYADHYVDLLISKLRELSILKDTIIFLFSSHGEGLLDHQKRYLQLEGPEFSGFGHTNLYYDEVLRVPLIIYHPGIKGKYEIFSQVQLIDIMPTILDFLDIQFNEEAQGKSVVPLIEGNASEDFNKYVFSEIGYGFLAVRTEKWKLICYEEECELYDLDNDPKESNNLSNKRPDIVSELFLILRKWHISNKNNS